MKRSFTLPIIILLTLTACDLASDDENNAWNSQNQNNSSNNLQTQLYTITGVVWSPGADDTHVLSENRFPIPGALVAAYPYEPDPPPEERFYCQTCLEVPKEIPSTISGFDGSFTLKLMPETDYYLVVQKGLFRRVTELRSGFSGETRNLEPSSPAEIRFSGLALPNTHDPEDGKWTPRILIIVGRGEGFLHEAYDALGLVGNIDYEMIADKDAEYIAANVSELTKYSIIVASCGDEATYLSKPRVRTALREYVKLGGRLFIDDFAYDWVEQPFPEFLSFQVDYTLDYQQGICAEGAVAPDQVGACVNYACYDPEGYTEDAYLQGWLDTVYDADALPLEYGCNIIRRMGEGVQGECDDLENPKCQGGLLIDTPKVWLMGKWMGSTQYAPEYVEPITVSWNYYCGKVLYTALHTHAGDEPMGGYKLLLQEKIMIYLLLELQTCITQEVVE
ncbi:hypothetical protein KKF84_21980 [Myxococcota bacterium]|nr:hypothetical protein [Myxococcota bacterium]